MVTIGGLIMICFFALIIPYQVKQRLRQIIPILATTKTGRRIYQIQLIASAFAAFFVGILQMAVYGIIWHLKGLSVFWRCESWGIASNSYWCDKLSFRNLYVTLYGSDLIICNRKYCDHWFYRQNNWKLYGSCCGFNSSLWSDDVPYEENLLYAFPDYKWSGSGILGIVCARHMAHSDVYIL